MGQLSCKAREFILHGGDQSGLLLECLETGTLEALHAVQILFEDMYGGITFNYELKAPAAFCLIRWENDGLKALVEAACRNPRSKNQSLALEILATLASGLRIPQIKMWDSNDVLVTRIFGAIRDWDVLFEKAGELLREYVLSFEDEGDLVAAIGLQIQKTSFSNPSLIEPLFHAMAGRWSAVSGPVLQEFGELLRDHAENESRFQEFFERNPLMIDPMALDVYPRPDIHGFREPDFLVRRTDNSFLVVEIETPAKSLMTKSNKLSAQATHAVAQVMDYEEFLTDRISSIRQHISAFRRPECLVVVGLESSLSAAQARSLRVDNESRNRVRVVGFDWLERRARSVRDNFISGRITVSPRLRIG